MSIELVNFRHIADGDFEDEIIQFKIKNQTFSQELLVLLNQEIDYYHQHNQLDRAIILEELRLLLAIQAQDDQELDFLLNLTRSLGLVRKPQFMKRNIELGKEYLERSLPLSIEICLLQSLLGASLSLYGVNVEIRPYYDRYKASLSQISELTLENNLEYSFYFNFYMVISIGMILFYFEDIPKVNRVLRSHLASLATQSIQSLFQEEIKSYKNNLKNRIFTQINTLSKCLRIGYISDCICQHSVGWLVRWTLKYHNPNLFEIYTYSTFNPQDFLHDRLIDQYGDHVRHIPLPIKTITDQIQADKIDILVDLGSLSEFMTCMVAAVKPAPIQVTWLGLDASAIPTIDYYLADRFSLPDDAQEYYSEKLIKMPYCYIAVDGFELDRPSLTRFDLGIPDTAILYLSSQSGYKRHPDHMKLQVQILAQVPQSYLLIKGMKTDESTILKGFQELAVSWGVESDRIKIMPSTPREETHRANLKIADVILDTYPYNGATTTLEALWCEVPLVTRVGQQFAARNSYSMLMNTGVTEGIAWTDEEYVNWGVRFGLNQDLRDRVRWKLRQSKRTSPLWDARQFTRDLEAVYQQIWERYLRVNGHEKFIIR
jgi:predicted O-linked N-acetylglucosamine transferase (SPINDLY family)